MRVAFADWAGEPLQVLEWVQNDPLVFESRGLVLQTMGDHQNAVEDFTSALLLVGEGAANAGEDHYYRGESLLALGRYTLALQDLNLALELGWTVRLRICFRLSLLTPFSPLPCSGCSSIPCTCNDETGRRSVCCFPDGLRLVAAAL